MVEIIKEELTEEERAVRNVTRTINLEDLVEGSRIFDSHGVSYLKVTYGEEVARIAMPIKSSGVAEMIDRFERDNKPTPPRKRTVVKPSDDLGKEMKITRNEFVSIFDLTDEKYQKELERYNRDLGLKILMFGIAIPFKDKSGKIIDDEAQKLEVLRGMGLTGEHLSQLVKDIQDLTKWEEVKVDNFLAQ